MVMDLFLFFFVTHRKTNHFCTMFTDRFRSEIFTILLLVFQREQISPFDKYFKENHPIPFKRKSKKYFLATIHTQTDRFESYFLTEMLVRLNISLFN